MLISNQGAKIFYTSIGSGPDLVLLHPFPSCHELWRPVAEQLATRYRITLLDVRGQGQSAAGDGPATMDLHASDLARVCRETGIQKAVFAGASIGGYILFEFLRRNREHVKALVLCNTKATADSDEARASRLKAAEEVLQRGTAPIMEAMLPKLLGVTTQRNRLDIVEATRNTMRFNTPAGISAVQRGMAQRPDSISTLKMINVPTLLIAGEEDALATQSDMQTMQQGIAGCELKVIPQAGHFAIFERPADTVRAMRKFLETLN